MVRAASVCLQFSSKQILVAKLLKDFQLPRVCGTSLL